MQSWAVSTLTVATIMFGVLLAIYNRAKLKLSANEIATLALSTASLAVAVLAYMQSRDNSDIQKAISQLTYVGKQSYRQANAMRKQVRQLRAQSREMNAQTKEMRTTASSTVLLATNASAQLRQRDRQFSLEQRPLVLWDADADASKNPLSDDKINGQLFWSYGLKNSGKSVAFNVIALEGISLGGGPFLESKRTVSKEFAPGDKAWSTAAIPVDPSILPIDIKLKPALRVMISFNDAQGNHYNYVLCHQFIEENGFPHDCSQLPVSKLPARSLR